MYDPEEELTHFGVKGMHWGHRNRKTYSTPKSEHKKKKMKTSTKIILATATVASIAALTYVGKKEFTKLMLKGAEDKYNEMVPVRDKLSEVKSLKDQTLRDYMRYNKEKYNMGKLYFAKRGFRV